jgi:hypothetical protein
MAITPIHATLTVTTAGTRVQANTDTDLKPHSIYIEASGANTGFIYVGLVTVTSAIYFTRLAAGEGFSLAAEGTARSGIQLSSIYIDSSVNGEKAQLTYLYSTGG